MPTIPSNISQILNQLGSKVKLIAVSKTKPNAAILEAYEAGFKRFGENKVQEMTQKHQQLAKDIEWHMIGHLQTNKVKYIAPYVSLIHGVDSFKLLKEINKEGRKNNRLIHCLLQIFIASEETKFGLSEEEAVSILTSVELKKLENIRISGLMGMASNVADTAQIRSEFRSLKIMFDSFQTYVSEQVTMEELSMGMSGDYHIAVEEGSTMVRVGSAIFGERAFNS